MHQAKYYNTFENNKIKCTLCPHECILHSGQVGICKTRKNIDGKLYTLAYSNPCAVNIDPIEKKPLQHFHPSSKTLSIATAGCSLSCMNCQNASISQVGPDKVKNYNLKPEQIVDLALKNNCKSISYTYTEPFVFFEYMLDTAKLAKDAGLKNIIVSSGFVNTAPLKELIPYLDAANIDLKSFNNEKYKQMSKATLNPVLNTLSELKNANIWLEITNLLIPEFNDDKVMISEMCNWLISNKFENTPLHFSKFYPTYKLTNTPATSTKTIEKAIKIAKGLGINYVYSGNIPGNKYEHTFCPKCGMKIIERVGYNVLKNKIKIDKCPQCGHKTHGVWG